MVEFELDRLPPARRARNNGIRQPTYTNIFSKIWFAGTSAMPRLIRAVIIFVLSPLLLLMLIGLAETAMSPKDATEINDMVMTVPDGSEAMERSIFGYGMAWGKRGATTAQLTTDISELGDRSQERAIFITRARRAVQASVNGEPLTSLGGPSRERDYKVFNPHIFIIPPSSAISPQILTLDLQTRQTQPYVSQIFIGKTENLRSAWSTRKFLALALIIAAASICAISAILSFAMGVRRSDRYAALSFGALMLSWFIIDLYYLGVTSNWPMNLSRAFYSSASFVLILASLNYMNEWTFRLRVIRTRIVPILTIALFAKIIPIFFVDGQIYFYILISADVIAAGCTLFLLGQLFLYLARNTDVSIFPAIIFLICVSAVVIDLLYTSAPSFGRFFFPETGITLHYGPIFSAFLALTIIAGFIRSFLQAQKVLSSSNVVLSARLAERETEIEQVYAAREAEMREAALVEERKRIMRDMHDGVGGRLLSLSLRARGDGLAPEEMSRELEDSLQELRLIVDSMDTADGDLELALGALRGRLEPALYTAGIALEWDAGELGAQPGYGPQEVLSIYRILQEAVTNAIRHSGAKHVAFKSRINEAGKIQISLVDDGKGLDANTIRDGAKGIANLRSRALSLGGQIDFENDNGLTITLTLPERN